VAERADFPHGACSWRCSYEHMQHIHAAGGRFGTEALEQLHRHLARAREIAPVYVRNKGRIACCARATPCTSSRPNLPTCGDGSSP
jgi:hypothetical protein